MTGADALSKAWAACFDGLRRVDPSDSAACAALVEAERVLWAALAVGEALPDVEGVCRFCDDAGPHEGFCCADCFDVLADVDGWGLPLEEQRRLVATAVGL